MWSCAHMPQGRHELLFASCKCCRSRIVRARLTRKETVIDFDTISDAGLVVVMVLECAWLSLTFKGCSRPRLRCVVLWCYGKGRWVCCGGGRRGLGIVYVQMGNYAVSSLNNDSSSSEQSMSRWLRPARSPAQHHRPRS